MTLDRLATAANFREWMNGDAFGSLKYVTLKSSDGRCAHCRYAIPPGEQSSRGTSHLLHETQSRKYEASRYLHDHLIGMHNGHRTEPITVYNYGIGHAGTAVSH